MLKETAPRYFDLNQFKMEYFEGDLYILDKNRWTNINDKVKTAKQLDFWLKGMIMTAYIEQMGSRPKNSKITNYYNTLMMNIHYNSNKNMTEIDNNNIVFLNGHFDKDMNWYEGKIPFTPHQIQLNYDHHAEGTELVKRFFDELTCQDVALQQTIFEVIGTAISARNMSVMPIFVSSHSTSGKGTLVDIITKITGINKLGKINHEAWLGDKQSSFSLSPIRNKTWVFMDELPQSLNKNATEKIKDYVDSKEYLSFERKGIDAEVMLNTTTFFAATNNNVNIYNVDDAIKRRIIWIPFNMNKVGKAKFTGSEIKEILNSKIALEWIIKKSMDAFTLVINKPGIRNEKYTIPQFSRDFWESMEESSVAKILFESTKILSGHYDNKSDYISNADLRDGLAILKEEEEFSKLTLPALKKEISNYFSAKRLGSAKDGHSKDKSRARGIRIEWFKNSQEPMVEFANGIMIPQSAYEIILEQQEKDFLEREQELLNNKGETYAN